jgi:hypothetical protein
MDNFIKMFFITQYNNFQVLFKTNKKYLLLNMQIINVLND